jgi:hypothetical protein
MHAPVRPVALVVLRADSMKQRTIQFENSEQIRKAELAALDATDAGAQAADTPSAARRSEQKNRGCHPFDCVLR